LAVLLHLINGCDGTLEILWRHNNHNNDILNNNDNQHNGNQRNKKKTQSITTLDIGILSVDMELRLRCVS
jgi:hypothetical protein